MSSTFNWIKYFGDFRFSISIKKSCLKCPICFHEVLGPLIFGNNKIDKLCTTNWLQRKRLLSTARIVNIQCASRLIGKMVTDAFGEYFLCTCYMWITFSTMLKMVEFISRGRHIMLQKLNIIFFRVALKPLALKKMLTVKKFSHESERLKISCQDLSVSYLVAWYYGKSRQT